MILFPFIYLLSFLAALYELIKNNKQGILLFLIFGLPIYITSLSIAFMYGLKSWIPVFQLFKELIIIFTLATLVISLKRKIKLHLVDRLILFYFSYNFAYIFLPIGTFSFLEKALAFKSIAFFPLVYFTGRLFNPRQIYLSRYFHYICLVGIVVAIIVCIEVILGVHLQTITGYSDYNFYYFNQEPSGNYGLTWTFEIQNGFKRFASFYSTPLEHSASTLVTVSVLAALITKDARVLWNKFTVITFISTLLSITFALSRASFVGYFIMLYVYAWINKKRVWLNFFHYGTALIIVLGLIWINEDLYDFIVNTFNFSNSSSITHLLEWIEGINAIINNPLGMGLGTSGRVAGSMGINIGGENQPIIIGVQTGLLSLMAYVFLYAYIVYISAKTFKFSTGKARKLALCLLMLKVGLIIPALTSEIESYPYISYLTWFLSGLLISMISTEIIPAAKKQICQDKLLLE